MSAAPILDAGLDAHVVVRRPGHTLDVALAAEAGDVVAVVGPNGAGKTTLLRALAGLVPLDEGHVACGGTEWESRRRRLEVQDRRTAMVFQDILLFPHLTARQNVAFSPRSRGASRRAALATADDWLARIGLSELAERKPAQLSGGQAQRVALARALAGDPVLLLLDEPMAALDVRVAMALRVELARHLREYGGISVLVTHDAVDVLTLATKVVVLEDGRVAQEGTPEEVAAAPRTEHVARLVGLNVLRGTSIGTVVRLQDAELVSVTPYDGEVLACFRPSAVTVTAEEPVGSARNRWRGRVLSAVPHGEVTRVHLDAAGGVLADVTPESVVRLGLTPGREMWVAVKASEIQIHPAG
ncbi:MAG TPA: ABC transporter ATP-binding protein [Nocardioidaceae bacterium]|nr:ABC transporter ATP-binding protein [Nocardioidaceae bacterium]